LRSLANRWDLKAGYVCIREGNAGYSSGSYQMEALSLGTPFYHQNRSHQLKVPLTAKVDHSSITLWLVKLLGYDYDIEYKQGRENVSADALSRIPNKEVYALTISTISTGLMAEIMKSYEGDAAVQEIIKHLQESTNSHPHYT